MNIGVNGAIIVANNHEQYHNGPENEHQTDLANNLTGRIIGMQISSNTRANNECAARARSGRLVTL